MSSIDARQDAAALQREDSLEKPARLHYLDWLQVLAILGVFIFHALSPFSALNVCHISNTESSALATFFNGFFALWGMPFFFLFGYILVADERFMSAIRSDWLLHLILGIGCTSFFFSSAAGVPVWDWIQSPGTLEFYVTWTLFGISSWCWTMFVFYIGGRFLDTTSRQLKYAREATYIFFFVHQPVILFIAYYAVQWDTGILVKSTVVVIGSFVVSLGFYELIVRRINPVRALFGMKPRTACHDCARMGQGGVMLQGSSDCDPTHR